MNAQANEHVTSFDPSVELLEKDSAEADVVRQRAQEGGVVAERAASEARLAVDPSELGDVACEVTRVRCGPAVAARVDVLAFEVRLEQHVDDAPQICAIRAERYLRRFFEVRVDEIGRRAHRAHLGVRPGEHKPVEQRKARLPTARPPVQGLGFAARPSASMLQKSSPCSMASASATCVCFRSVSHRGGMLRLAASR